MGYLQCTKCGGYYKLKGGEKPEDFDNICQCGGEIVYRIKISDNEVDEDPDLIRPSMWNYIIENKGLALLGILILLMMGLVLIFSSAISSANSYQDVLPPEMLSAQKPMVIDLQAPRCPACQKFEKETLPDAKVQEVMKSYTFLRINVDLYPQLSQRFGVNVIPTIVILDKEGREVKRNKGYMDPEKFVKFLQL